MQPCFTTFEYKFDFFLISLSNIKTNQIKRRYQHKLIREIKQATKWLRKALSKISLPPIKTQKSSLAESWPHERINSSAIYIQKWSPKTPEEK